MNDSMRSRQQPGDRPRSAGPGQGDRHGSVGRRAFLTTSGALLGGGLVASRLGFGQPALAHDAGHTPHPIWAATRHRDRYLALAGSGESPEVRELVRGSAGQVAPGATVATLPDGFTATALLSTGGRILVAGAMPHDTLGVASLRPALYDVATTSELPLTPSLLLGFGVATAITSTGPRRLAVTVEGSDDVEQQYNAVTWIATSDDAGLTWTVDTLAEDLGEGFPSHLTAAGGRTLAVTTAASGRRLGHQSIPGGEWQRVPADPAEGTLLAIHLTRGHAFELIDRSPEGAVRRFRRPPVDTAWQAAGTIDIGQHIVAVVPVTGAPGELVAVGDSRSYLVGHA